MQKTILHIDFDSFFASVEQQDNPKLRNRPIGVTAHNSGTAIIAASREAKKLGISASFNTREAFAICPHLILTGANFERYFEISKAFIKICKDFSPQIEVFSIDELFMDVTLTQKLFGDVNDLIAQLKRRIKEEIGEYITVSVGVSYNKLLAKLGSGLDKPNGVTYITPQNLPQIYARAKLTDICGIGGRIERRLNSMGVFTLPQLANVPLRMLMAEFGNVEGRFLKQVGLGEDSDPVHSFTQAPEAKSVGRQYCLARNEYDERVVLQNIYELCEELAIKLRRLNKKTRHIGLSLRGSIDISGHLLLNDYTSSGKSIFNNCMQVLNKQLMIYEAVQHASFETGFNKNTKLHIPGYVRRMGVWVSDLVDRDVLPIPLFPQWRKEQKLDEVVDKINDKFGSYTIRNGFLLYAKKLKTVPNGFLGDRYERLQLAQDKSLQE